MKICFVWYSDYYKKIGGLEQLNTEYVEYLKKLNYDISIIRIDEQKRNNLYANIRNIIKSMKIKEADIIIFNQVSFYLRFYFLLSNNLRKKSIVWEHGEFLRIPKYKQIITKLLLNNIKIIAVSNHLKKSINTKKCYYCYPFITTKFNTNRIVTLDTNNNITIGLLNTKRTVKNSEKTIEWLAEYQKEHTINIVILGDKPLIDDFEYYYMDWLAKEDMNIFYSNIDCFISSSLYEGFGLMIIERKYFNIPCIVYNRNGIHEVINKEDLVFSNKFEFYQCLKQIKKCSFGEKPKNLEMYKIDNFHKRFFEIINDNM